MEEKKLNKEQEVKQLPYEELNKIAAQLSRENEWYSRKLAEAEATLKTINRLDVLMRIIDINNSADKFHFSDDFISNCITEVEEIVTLPKEEPKNEEQKPEGN